MPMAFYIYFATIHGGQSASCQETCILVFAKPPAKGQQIALKSTGEWVVLTNVNHYRMTIDAFPIESAVSTAYQSGQN